MKCYAWLAFKWLSEKFLGKNKAPDYKGSTNNLIESYKGIRYYTNY